MVEKRETLIAPLGYMTTPNQYGVFPPGALAQAENVLMRAKGKLLTSPGLGALQTGGANDSFIYKVMPLDAGHAYTFAYLASGTSWEAREANNVAGFPPLLASVSYPFTRTSPVRSRERMLVNSNQGVLVGDSMAPTNGTQRALRYAGLPQVGVFVPTSTGGTGFPIPPGIMVSYCAVVTREFSDGYIVKSVPSAAEKFFNNTTSTFEKVSLGVTLSPSTMGDFAVGDIVEIYRTDGLATSTVNADPGTTFKLIIRYTLTSSDIAAHFVTLLDEVPLLAPFYSTTGKELYTNPYQEGSTGANRQPEINGAQAVFKGFTFFGNITERPQATFSVPGGIWSEAGTVSATYPNARASIGTRSGAGTVTSGSATVTGISAADMIGVRIGQEAQFGFPPLARVTVVGGTSFTMSAAATSSGAVWQLSDVIEVSALNTAAGYVRINSGMDLISNFMAANGSIEVTANQTTGIGVNTLSGDVLNDIGLVISIEPARPNVTSFTMRASGGNLYSPPLPLTTATAKTFSQTTTPNLLRWSKDSEPEHAPADNETRVGSGKIIQLVGTKDALWIFCTDGIFRLSGDAGVWRLDVVAPGCVLCSPGCAVSMRDAVFAYTNYGFVAVTDAGVNPISDLVIKAQLPGPPYVEGVAPNAFIVNNDDDEEVLIFPAFPSTMFYVYNARHEAFTYVKNGPTGLNRMTAAAYQQNPASGNASVLIANTDAVAGSAARYTIWSSDNTAFLGPKVQYRALYGKNPMSVKQWIDVTYIFDASISNLAFGPTFSGVDTGGFTLPVAGQNDWFATAGVPRAYAIATSIQPGYSHIAQGHQNQFEGLSLRLVELGIQQVRR